MCGITPGLNAPEFFSNTLKLSAYQIFAPKWVAVVIAIANIFVPDIVPVIDEVLGIVIVVLRIKSS